MSAERHNGGSIETSNTGRDDILLSRRRMLRRSLGAAAPVVVTLASGPVLAGNCVVASSFVSATTFTSRHPGSSSSFSCAINTREYYLNDRTCRGYLNDNNFEDVFNPAISGLPRHSKLDEVLQIGPVGGELEVASRLVWLHMNLKYATGTTGDMGSNQAKAIWANYKSNGNAYQTAGITWNSAELITYLKFVLGA